MTRRLGVYLSVSMTWAALAGLGIWLADVDLVSLPGVLVLALLYMPSPSVAAVVAERGLVRSRFRLPSPGWRPVLTFVLAPVALAVTVVLLVLAAVAVGGDLLGVPAFGTVATTSSAVVTAATGLLGQEAVRDAGPPPPLPVLLAAAVWGAFLAGWSVNGLAAMGEEYGWRGLMWDELRRLGPVRANLAIGTVWGLWHAPLVLQGYNFPDHPALGVLGMVVFCVCLSVPLTALRELTGSVLPVAAAHGTVNALVPLLLLVTLGAHPLVAGPLGVVGSVAALVVGTLMWAVVRRRERAGAPARAAGAAT